MPNGLPAICRKDYAQYPERTTRNTLKARPSAPRVRMAACPLVPTRSPYDRALLRLRRRLAYRGRLPHRSPPQGRMLGPRQDDPKFGHDGPDSGTTTGV